MNYIGKKSMPKLFLFKPSEHSTVTKTQLEQTAAVTETAKCTQLLQTPDIKSEQKPQNKIRKQT